MSSFAFGFGGDDIEADENDLQTPGEGSSIDTAEGEVQPSVPPKSHDIRELVEDVGDSNAPLEGLDNSDLTTNVYEGGFKSWECSIDLVKYLLDRGPRKDLDDLCRVNHIIEFGCGTALPTLLMFQYALVNSLQMYFTLTDYNASVLRTCSFPNLFLTYCSTLPATEHPFSESEPNPLANLNDADPDEEWQTEDLIVTEALKEMFLANLSESGVHLTLISGSWCPPSPFLSLFPTNGASAKLNTFVVASETIYSIPSLKTFSAVLMDTLRPVSMGKAIIAAKKVYFGVGGGVQEFRQEIGHGGGVAWEIVDFDLGQDAGGVGRCLLEVQTSF
ncbi:hypothetical protein P152DRAFT_402996 [Eremomyces bilateralis CBS 781.70]|uniref:protein-histidine N-methyltransferase n=1 Tax=Eremomyces bilateralis CBS 781.70 TaxID=1392243 RepID=A0A6G1FV22_9PEZI|nr:uncharacterized protein P152DRAFT_402996 [Eremomyces bilateralis CBS 781.70]KAF1809667.1 hypothetical protein P152DRAFT_402996 [Eremomyces bilateralis CBS 781.70]